MINNVFSDKIGENIIIPVFINGLKWGIYEHWPEVKTIIVVRLECTNFNEIDKVFILFSVKAPFMSHQNPQTPHWGKSVVCVKIWYKQNVLYQKRGVPLPVNPIHKPLFAQKNLILFRGLLHRPVIVGNSWAPGLQIDSSPSHPLQWENLADITITNDTNVSIMA